MSFGAFCLRIFPILLLVFLMTKKKSVPSYKALLWVAITQFIVLSFFFNFSNRLLTAKVIEGALTALTPILVIWGAVFLFRTMQQTGSMEMLTCWLKNLTPEPIAQMMIVGWSFSFLLEGTSGFGTPTAIAAPILVGLGFPRIRTAAFCLVMNSVAVSFGAMGLALWFGLGQIGLSVDQLQMICRQTAIIHFISALFIPIIGLKIVFTWTDIKQNLSFIYLSILGCMGPYLFLSRYGYELPTIVGGLFGIFFTTWLAAKKSAKANIVRTETDNNITAPQLLKAAFPLWGTVAVLLITRIDQLGIKSFLLKATPTLEITVGGLGDLSISPSLVMALTNILGTNSNWTLELLYIPAILPFFLVSVITFIIFKSSMKTIKMVTKNSTKQMIKPIFALLGALIFVKLLMVGGGQSTVQIIGIGMADATGTLWMYFASFLGAFGSFFSGSNTVSNLTFGAIQLAIAQNLHLDFIKVLSLQTVGGSIGTMVSISNIIAICTVLGLSHHEGEILKKTAPPTLAYCLIASLVVLLIP